MINKHIEELRTIRDRANEVATMTTPIDGMKQLAWLVARLAKSVAEAAGDPDDDEVLAQLQREEALIKEESEKLDADKD